MPVNYTLIRGNSPIVATAIHDGHACREEIAPLFNLSAAERLREEDPFTAEWTRFSDNRIVFHQSRFETDVNRPREKAVYRRPEDAWGLKVWKDDPDESVIASSLQLYDRFYEELKQYFDHLFTVHRRVVVYDIHSYNHRRDGQDIEAAPGANPEINLGTKNMDRGLWAPVVNSLLEHFRSFDYRGRQLDARENIKFQGGYFGQWLYERYGEDICPVSIEFKKFFMDEWTGKPFTDDIRLISGMLGESRVPVIKAMTKLPI